MKSTGQRQDVAFLGLAVAVLAIAVALFVVMRAIPKQRPAEPEKEVETSPAPPEPTKPPEPDSSRDPFRSQAQPGAGAPAPQTPGPQAQLTLKGITWGRNPRAVIYRGTRSYHVAEGSRMAGFTVVTIAQDRVVLQGDSGALTLLLEPLREDEEQPGPSEE